MRTTVVLDERLLKEAKEITGIKTTRQVIHEALDLLVRLQRQAGVQSLRGRLNWEGDLENLRGGRSGDTR